MPKLFYNNELLCGKIHLCDYKNMINNVENTDVINFQITNS